MTTVDKKDLESGDEQPHEHAETPKQETENESEKRLKKTKEDFDDWIKSGKISF